jgi:hypothetical protein
MYGTMGAGEFCTGINYSLDNKNSNNVDFWNCQTPTQDTWTSVDCSTDPNFSGCMSSKDPWLNYYVMYNPQQTDIPLSNIQGTDDHLACGAELLAPYFTHSANMDYFSWSGGSASPGDVSNAMQAFYPRSFRGNAGMTNPPGYTTDTNNIQTMRYYNGGQVCGDDVSGNFGCPGLSYTGYSKGNWQTIPGC